MQLIPVIAKRYLLGKKSTNVIHLITWISVLGMAVGSAALILILSVFNGFEGLLSGLLNAFHPDVKVEIAEGKFYTIDSIPVDKIKMIDGINQISMTLEESSFFEHNGSQEIGILKGVDEHYNLVNDFDSSLIQGELKLMDSSIVFGVLGSTMNNKLSVNPYELFSPITAYMPSKKSTGIPGKEFKSMTIYPSGIFSVGNEVDAQYVLIGLRYMNDLMGMKNQCSAIEIKLNDKTKEKAVMSALSNLLGPKFTVKNKAMQDDGFFKIMNIEKWVSYLIACLTMLIIAFNLVGSLWMIVLEKKKDISVLKSMGMTSNDIRKIFLSIGIYVALAGLLTGFAIALIFYSVQTNYGIISIPDGFIIDAYPIELKWTDFVIVSITVLLIGISAAWLPAQRAAAVTAFVRHE